MIVQFVFQDDAMICFNWEVFGRMNGLNVKIIVHELAKNNIKKTKKTKTSDEKIKLCDV